MSDENELLEPLATEAGQQAIVRAIRDMSSLEYAVRAERAATNAAQSADEALNSANDASDSEEMARKWATKTDGAVAQETIEIPPEQEGDDPTTETINLYSAKYYAALAEETYNNMQFDNTPTENSTNLLSSGTIYTALNGKADKSTTYTKTEVDTALGNVQSTLTFDNVPTANSDNPVKSSGIKTALDGKQDTLTFDSTPTANSTNPVTSGGVYTALQNVNIDIDDEITEDSDNPVTSAAIYEALQNFTPSGGGSGGNITIDNELISGSQNPVSGDGIVDAFDNILSNVQSATEFTCNSEYYFDEADEFIDENGSSYNAYKSNNIPAIICMYNYADNWYNTRIISPIQAGTLYYGNTTGNASGQYYDSNSGVTWYWSSFQVNRGYTNKNCPILNNGQSVGTPTSDQVMEQILAAAQPVFHVQKAVVLDSTPTENSTNLVTSGGVYAALQNIPSGSSITVDSTITQGGTNPVEGGAIYTALGNKADQSTTYTKTEVDTALTSKGDVTTNTDQNITGTKTFVGSKKVGFKQSTANDKLGFTLFGNTGTERGYLEFNPTNTIDGVAGLMTLGNYATSAGALTHVGFRRYSNISGANGAYNLLTPLIADARTPFSLTTTYQNFYLPLGFTYGTTTVKTAKSGVVDLSPLLASLESRIAALEGN